MLKEISGYYLHDNFFFPCYSSCGNCSQGGDLNVHNCINCKENYININELNKPGNCYQKCTFYYYISFGNYECTTNNECPPEHIKLITNKNKCIDSCDNDDTYQFDYNNICYYECPHGTINILNIKMIIGFYHFSKTLQHS